MELNKRNISTIFLILGMIAFAAGWLGNNQNFTWAAIVFISLYLVIGGRLFRPRRRK